MKKIIVIVTVCSSLLLFGCQNKAKSNIKESSIITEEGRTIIPEEVNTSNSEESTLAIAEDGTVVPIVPEEKRLYVGIRTWIDGTDLYKITQDKEDKINRESDIVVDGKNYYLLYILPNPFDDTKENLWYEEY